MFVQRIAAKVIFPLLLSLGLAACQTTGAPQPLNQDYVGTFHFSNGQALPLPEGTWTSVGRVERRNNHNNRLETITLVNLADRRVQGLVVARTNIDHVAGGWIIPKLCQRSDIHLAEVESYSTTDSFCWGVVHGDFTKNFSKYWKAVLDPYFEHVRAQGLEAPKAMIDVELYKAVQGRFLSARYYRNPEADGFPAPEVAVWKNSDWNLRNVAADPEKQAYIETLKAWGREMIPRFKAAL